MTYLVLVRLCVDSGLDLYFLCFGPVLALPGRLCIGSVLAAWLCVGPVSALRWPCALACDGSVSVLHWLCVGSVSDLRWLYVGSALALSRICVVSLLDLYT